MARRAVLSPQPRCVSRAHNVTHVTRSTQSNILYQIQLWCSLFREINTILKTCTRSAV